MDLKCIFPVLLLFTDCDFRSVSLLVKHQQYFFLQDDGEREHIPLTDSVEHLLELDQIASDALQSHLVYVKDKKAKDENITEKIVANKEDTVNVNKVKDETVESVELDKNNEDYYSNDNSDTYDDNTDDIGIAAATEAITVDNDNNLGLKLNSNEKIADILKEDYNLDTLSGLRNRYRKRRAVNEQWINSLPGKKLEEKQQVDSEPNVWEEVTDNDLEMGHIERYKEIAKYIGVTLLSVIFFVLVSICFIRDPMTCILAFGTGCPCCLICCPCIRAFTDKYLNTKQLVRDSLNKYMPGIIVKEDNTLDYYPPTPGEIEILHELLEEIAG